MQRAANIILIALFALALWLPTADSLLHLDHATAFNEKRQPASFPAFKIHFREVQPFVQGLEAYFNDHFGFRRQLIRWHLDCQIALFKTRVSQNVVLGRDGWMFYTLDGTTTPTKPLSQQDLI